MITYEEWDRARKKAYPDAIHYSFGSKRREDDSLLASFGPPDPPMIRELTLEQIKDIGETLEDKLVALVEKWKSYKTGPSDDDPSYDFGFDTGVRTCGDELEEILIKKGVYDKRPGVIDVKQI